MLNQTIDAYKKVKHDLFIAKTISKIVVSLLTATYFTCAIIFKFGNYYANIVLASLFGLYTIFDIVSFKLEKTKRITFRRIYKIINFTIRLLAIGSSIYALYYSTGDVSLVVPVFTTLVIILWIVQVIFELVIYVFEREYTILVKAIKEDLAIVTETINTGKEIVEAVKDGTELVTNKVTDTVNNLPSKFKKVIEKLRIKFRLLSKNKKETINEMSDTSKNEVKDLEVKKDE